MNIRKTSISIVAGVIAALTAASAAAAPDVALVRERAEQGVVESQFALGNMYFKGNAMAQLKLGFIYEDGRGVPQDKKAAKDWYHKACENKHELGCNYEQRLIDEGVQ